LRRARHGKQYRLPRPERVHDDNGLELFSLAMLDFRDLAKTTQVLALAMFAFVLGCYSFLLSGACSIACAIDLRIVRLSLRPGRSSWRTRAAATRSSRRKRDNRSCRSCICPNCPARPAMSRHSRQREPRRAPKRRRQCHPFIWGRLAHGPDRGIDRHHRRPVQLPTRGRQSPRSREHLLSKPSKQPI
jgi:hypothetical protein